MLNLKSTLNLVYLNENALKYISNFEKQAEKSLCNFCNFLWFLFTFFHHFLAPFFSYVKLVHDGGGGDKYRKQSPDSAGSNDNISLISTHIIKPQYNYLLKYITVHIPSIVKILPDMKCWGQYQHSNLTLSWGHNHIRTL